MEVFSLGFFDFCDWRRARVSAIDPHFWENYSFGSVKKAKYYGGESS